MDTHILLTSSDSREHDGQTAVCHRIAPLGSVPHGPARTQAFIKSIEHSAGHGHASLRLDRLGQARIGLIEHSIARRGAAWQRSARFCTAMHGVAGRGVDNLIEHTRRGSARYRGAGCGKARCGQFNEPAIGRDLSLAWTGLIEHQHDALARLG